MVLTRAGLGSDDVATFSSVPQFGANPGQLEMFVFVPDGLQPHAALVVNLHGCKQGAREYSVGVGWLELANRFGFALLAPSQTTTNNRQRCFNWFDPAKAAAESTSIDQMIQWMLANYPLGPRRVFITGLSAGGAMASNMMALYPQRFAGGAVVAGLAYGSASNLFEALDVMANGPSQPVAHWGDVVRSASQYRGPWPRISVWHGTADRRVHPSNGEAIVQQWLSVHGLAAESTWQREPYGAYRRAWSLADGQEVVEQYVVPGMQHGAPVEAENPISPFLINMGISSTYLIAQFWGLAPRLEPTRMPAASRLRRMFDQLLRLLRIRR